MARELPLFESAESTLRLSECDMDVRESTVWVDKSVGRLLLEVEFVPDDTRFACRSES